MPKQHRSTAAKKLLTEIRKQGFTVSEKTKRGSVKITPPAGVKGPVYHTHATESSVHQMKRDFKNLYQIDVS